MTYQAPKSDSFNRIISFRNTLLINNQNLCPKWLRRDAGASLRGVWKGLQTQKIYDFSFFPCKSYIWNSVTAAKTIHYADLDLKNQRDLNNLLKWCPWHDAMEHLHFTR